MLNYLSLRQHVFCQDSALVVCSHIQAKTTTADGQSAPVAR